MMVSIPLWFVLVVLVFAWTNKVAHHVEIRGKDSLISTLNKLAHAQAKFIQSRILTSEQPTKPSTN